MKKTVMMSAAILLAGLNVNVMAQQATAAADAAADSPVINLSMEQWEPYSKDVKKQLILVDKMVPAGWTPTIEGTGKGEISQDKQVKRSGDSSVKIVNSTENEVVCILQWDIPVKPSTTYKITAWYKGQGVQSGKHGPMMFVNAGTRDNFWKDHKGVSKNLSDKSGDFDWTPLSATITTRDNDRMMLINLQLRGATGTVWIDDLSFEEVK